MLTTPKLKGFDSVFPGERWFFYWKTSPSLWESKLADYAAGSSLYVPLNWGLHTENPDQYDFGELKPETDLKKLFDIAQKQSVKLTFLLPLSPVPYLANGGIPSFLAKTHSVGDGNLYLSSIDGQGRVHKLFSFFNPRVFQYYQKFTKRLEELFRSEGIDSSVVGLKAYYFDGDKESSFFYDRSRDYEAGFQRYINQLKDEEQISVEDFQSGKVDGLHEDYQSLLEELYCQTCVDNFSDRFLGEQKFLFLGADPEAYIYRCQSAWKENPDYLSEVFFALSSDIIPSSALLSEEERNKPLVKSLDDILNSNFVREKLDETYYNENSSEFSMLRIFDFQNFNEKDFNDLGLELFFQRNFCWTYRFNKELKNEDIESLQVCIAKGRDLDESQFNFLLRSFMFGVSLVLDTNEMPEDLKRRLNIFLGENGIVTETVKLASSLTLAKLGEGKLFIFDSSEGLSSSDETSQLSFWKSIVEFINIHHPRCEADDGAYYLWKTRFSNSYELNYEQVRRVSFYNPSSYKRKGLISHHKNFAFVKSIDESDGSYKSTNKGVEIELKPGGSISLDYGYFN